MKRLIHKSTVLFAIFNSLLIAPLAAQDSQEIEQFSSGNAIMDTSIPFSNNAREARQSLRGSFGWATYQEGSKDGTFYRFDPDGFARFSTSPRFDENVFEVQCAADTLQCTATKQGLIFSVDLSGAIIVGHQNANLRSQFTLFDGSSEMTLNIAETTQLSPEAANQFLKSINLRVQNGALAPVEIDLRGVSHVYDYILWVARKQGRGQATVTAELPSLQSQPLVSSGSSYRNLVNNENQAILGTNPVATRPLGGELAKLRGVLQTNQQVASIDSNRAVGLPLGATLTQNEIPQQNSNTLAGETAQAPATTTELMTEIRLLQSLIIDLSETVLLIAETQLAQSPTAPSAPKPSKISTVSPDSVQPTLQPTAEQPKSDLQTLLETLLEAQETLHEEAEPKTQDTTYVRLGDYIQDFVTKNR